MLVELCSILGLCPPQKSCTSAIPRLPQEPAASSSFRAARVRAGCVPQRRGSFIMCSVATLAMAFNEAAIRAGAVACTLAFGLWSWGTGPLVCPFSAAGSSHSLSSAQAWAGFICCKRIYETPSAVVLDCSNFGDVAGSGMQNSKVSKPWACIATAIHTLRSRNLSSFADVMRRFPYI